MQAHVSLLEEEKRFAERLCREIERIKLLANESHTPEIMKLLTDAEGLHRFFSASATVMDENSREAELTIRRIHSMLEENRMHAENVIHLDADNV